MVKYIGGILAVMGLVVGLFYLFITNNVSEEDILYMSTEVADEYVSFYSSDSDSMDVPEGVSKEALADLMKLKQEFKMLDDSRIDMDVLFTEKFPEELEEIDEEVTGSPSAGDDPNTDYSYEPENKDVVDESDKDTRIIEEDGKNYMYTKDFVFTDGVDLVRYKGRSFDVYKEDINPTYQMLLSDPKYTFKYKSHILGENTKGNYIEFLYCSILDSSLTVKLRVYNDGDQLTAVEVL